MKAEAGHVKIAMNSKRNIQRQRHSRCTPELNSSWGSDAKPQRKHRKESRFSMTKRPGVP